MPWWNILAVLGTSGLDRQAMLQGRGDWVLALLSPVMLLVIITFSRKLLFDHGRAVWVDGEKLNFLPMFWNGRSLSMFRSLPLRSIDRFAVGMMGSGLFKGINIYLKDGTQDEIPAHLLQGPRDVVLARLNEVLAANR